MMARSDVITYYSTSSTVAIESRLSKAFMDANSDRLEDEMSVEKML